MARKTCFIENGEWYKGNTHLHTTLSDGKLTPQEIADVYKGAGYDFIAFADHWCYGNHRELGTDKFLVFPGVEMNIDLPPEKGITHHVTALAHPEETPHLTGDRLEEIAALGDMVAIVESMNKSGHICIYAHPNWSHTKMEEFDRFGGCIGMEIYNNATELHAGCGYSDAYYDRCLWERRPTLCFAVDDAHSLGDTLGGYICVKAAALSHGDIIDAIKAGSFYASAGGPKIDDFYVENGQAHISCSPCSDIIFYTDSRRGSRVVRDCPGTKGALYALPEKAAYVYAVCIDDGGKSWTQMICVKESE